MDEESIFAAARQLESPTERQAFLDRACAGDACLRADVEQLLAASDQAGSFLEHPPAEVQGTGALGGPDSDTVKSGDAGFSLPHLQPCETAGRLGRLGTYEVMDVLGRGGMGVVLRAHDPKLDRVVAVKVLACHLAANATARQRFLREARAAAAVNHPHVVTIHAVDEAEGTPYIVMELVSGRSLQERIDQDGPPEVREVLRIGAQIALGLRAAHAQGLIHRDIKPSNILLENAVERVKITDFGLARAADDVAMTQTGMVAGTPQYMSPEQARGEPVDARSDLFSLGVVLYAMCTGRSPFRAESAVAALKRVCEDKPKPIRKVNPDVPVWLVKIVDRLLAKRPEKRFQSAADVVKVLTRHLAHLQHPSVVSAPSLEDAESLADEEPSSGTDPYLPRRRSRRRLLMMVAILLAVLAVGGLTEATGVTHLAGTVITVLTGQGALVIEVDDPTVKVSLDGEEITIKGGGIEEIKLRPGQYTLAASKDGRPVPLQRELVTVTRGGRQVVRVSVEPSAIPAAAGSPAPRLETTPADHEVRRFVGHTAGLQSVVISADGKRILTAGCDATLRLWDLETGAELRRFEGHSQLVRSAAFLRDGRRLASASFDRTVRIWDAQTGKLLHSLKGHRDQVWSVAALKDGDRVVSASLDKTVRVWDVDSGQQVAILDLDQPVCSVAALPDGRHVLCGDKAGVVQLWDLDKPSLVRRLEGHADRVKGIAVSPDGRRALSAGGMDGTVRLWDLEAGKEIRRFEGHGDWAHGGAFSRDGKLALTGGNTVMYLWDLETGRKLWTFKAPGHFAGVAFGPDALRAVSASWDGPKPEVVRLWELPECVWPEQAVLERLAQVSKSIETRRADADLLTQRGRLHVRLGRHDEAARDFIGANDLLASPWGWDATSSVFDSVMQRDEVFARIAELRGDDTALWIARGQYHALRSQWRRAVEDYARAVGTDARADWALQYGILLLLTGADDEYRRLCAQLVERSGEKEECDFHLASTCALSDQSGVDPQQILRWARIPDDHTRNKFNLHTLGMANYRAGQLEQAVKLMHETIDQSGGGIGASTAFPLALFHHALGQKEESRRWYDLGAKEIQQVTPRNANDPAPWAAGHWMYANLFHRQAKALLEPTEPKPLSSGLPEKNR